MSLATDVIMSVAAALLLVAAMIGVNRIAAGPSQLDRSVAADLMVAVVVAGLGLWTAWTDQPTYLMVLMLLSLLGFTSAVSIARMVGDRMAMRSKMTAKRKEEAVRG
ncbi:monovalent cation/H+ antiporter complex subunit F [Tessaracoccus lacteus]|uniref:Monovalent cation/H+ antiporter complex subunit F n=1 Tax=Tessaracoccus lacteus TaxID=3041766 RepID=A0ABY8PXV8_9ACTN|nr:monovalent cation/H+ antiporter complex subunit F [Tessaracoccus sp. T21]WGT47131.1 monovalent cation/H+ antiporter complex subunit F [Tessaracoccus sp. T21]